MREIFNSDDLAAKIVSVLHYSRPPASAHSKYFPSPERPVALHDEFMHMIRRQIGADLVYRNKTPKCPKALHSAVRQTAGRCFAISI